MYMVKSPFWRKKGKKKKAHIRVYVCKCLLVLEKDLEL